VAQQGCPGTEGSGAAGTTSGASDAEGASGSARGEVAQTDPAVWRGRSKRNERRIEQRGVRIRPDS